MTSLTPIALGAHTGFSVTEAWYAPTAMLGTHHHDHATLSLVFKGSHEERVGRRTHTCSAFSLTYKPQDILHSNVIGPAGFHGLFVDIADDRAATAGGIDGLPRAAVCIESPAVAGLIARVALELKTRDTAFELAVEGLLLELWAQSARPSAMADMRAPRWLVRAREFLHAHFKERKTLAEIAAAAGVHPVHLAQVHRRVYGMSVGSYVRKLRIEFARQALTDPELSLSRIALDAGFADHGHFTRSFRQETGLAPSRYRGLLELDA